MNKKDKGFWISLIVLIVLIIGSLFIFRHDNNSTKSLKLHVLLDNSSVSISPSTVSVKSGAQQQFLVTEMNVPNPNGQWSANIGTIDANGLYTSPSVTVDTSVTISFTAIDGLSATASLTVISPVDGPATLPQLTVNSAMADTPAPGNVIQVPLTGLQASLNAANCGDTLMLQPGLNYSGNFVLPNKNCDNNHWVIIRSATADSNLPPEGTRINPCYAGVTSLPGRPAFSCPTPGVMAKVSAVKSAAAFALASGAGYYRIGPGLEITRPVGTGLNYGLIEPSTQSPADHLVIDRDWIHGTTHDETTRGIFLSGITYVGIVDSYLNDFHCIAGIGTCSDAQAISGGTGQLVQGTWKIENNFIEASTENILFGGVLNNSATPSDIVIRKNHLFKPLLWMPGQPGFTGGLETATAKCNGWDPTGSIGQCPFVVKNLFELKNAQRVLFEDNILEYTWPGFTQHGNAILMSGLNPPGAYSTVSLADITIRHNRIAHTTSGFVVANMGTNGVPNLPVARVSSHDNIFDDLGPAYYNGDSSVTSNLPYQLNSCNGCTPLQNISIDHNTMILQTPKIGLILGATAPNLLQGINFSDNIVTTNSGLAVTGVGANGPCGNYGATNLARINSCLANPYTFAGNILIGATGTWPTGNTLVSDATTVGFTNYNNGIGGDYTLLSTSPYKGKATDGTDPGANVALVNQAIAGVN